MRMQEREGEEVTIGFSLARRVVQVGQSFTIGWPSEEVELEIGERHRAT